MYHNLCPAAGHHARENSETSSWPGLYDGLSTEEEAVEDGLQRRHCAVEAASDEHMHASHDVES